MTTSLNDQALFDSSVRALEAKVANVGAHLVLDPAARQAYARQIKMMADGLRAQATIGKISWAQAAVQAQDTRNAIMEITRGRSTPVGRAMAERLKSEGKSMNELIARKNQQLFGTNANFNRLTPTQQNAVYAEIVKFFW